MKFIASVVLLAAIQVISSKKWFGNLGRNTQINVADVDQCARANADSFALNVGIGNANANSAAVATNNNRINQRNFD